MAQGRLGAALLVDALCDVPAAVADLPAAIDQAGEPIKLTHCCYTLSFRSHCGYIAALPGTLGSRQRTYSNRQQAAFNKASFRVRCKATTMIL